MKSTFLLSLLMLLLFTTFSYSGKDSTKVFIASWNLQNLFDTIDDPEKKDEEFTPEGLKEWTNERLAVKLDNLAKVVKYMNLGEGPDILAIQEVENENIADSLVERCRIFKNYGLAYSESEDERGIDVGLIYNRDLFTLMSVVPHTIPLDFKTRPELEVTLKTKIGDTLIFYVNHWPSRSRGKEKSEPNRVAASTNLLNVIKGKKQDNIIILGDFNDEPVDISIKNLLSYKSNDETKLVNLATKVYEDSLGSFFYRSQWDMLDQIIISQSLLKGSIQYVMNSFKVIKPVFMVTMSGKYKDSPFPTYGGSRYLGGYSDHFPVGAYFIIKNRD